MTPAIIEAIRERELHQARTAFLQARAYCRQAPDSRGAKRRMVRCFFELRDAAKAAREASC